MQRGIEVELTFQAARVQGAELTAAQRQGLEQIAARDQSDLEHCREY